MFYNQILYSIKDSYRIKAKEHPWICRKMIFKLFPFFKVKKSNKSYENQFTPKPEHVYVCLHIYIYVIWYIEYQDKVNQNKKKKLPKWLRNTCKTKCVLDKFTKQAH